MAKPITISDDEMTEVIDDRVRRGWSITTVRIEPEGAAEIDLRSPDGFTESVAVNHNVAWHAHEIALGRIDPRK